MSSLTPTQAHVQLLNIPFLYFDYLGVWKFHFYILITWESQWRRCLLEISLLSSPCILFGHWPSIPDLWMFFVIGFAPTFVIVFVSTFVIVFVSAFITVFDLVEISLVIPILFGQGKHSSQLLIYKWDSQCRDSTSKTDFRMPNMRQTKRL